MTAEQSELDGLRALDPQVITTIHRQYFPEVYRYALYRLGDECLAEDIASEVFTRLLEAVNADRAPHTTLRGWLMRTASNLINDHLRQTYAHPTEALGDREEMRADNPPPIQFAEQAEQARSVRSALQELTSDQQQVIALRFGGGYSLEETAELMDKNANAIKSLQYRALASLRKLFRDQAL